MNEQKNNPQSGRLLKGLGGVTLLILAVTLFYVINSVYESYQARQVVPDRSTLQGELAALPVGDPQAGAPLFEATGCAACHSLDAETQGPGPTLGGLAQRLPAARADYPVTLYLYESILYPGAYLTEGYRAGVMPATYRARLSDQQLADLIAFLAAR